MAKANGTNVHNWDQYVTEAEVDPFILKTPDSEISVSNPTGVQIMRLSQGLRSGDLDVILMGLCGDQYQVIVNLLGKVGHKALPKLIEDLMDHFELYEDIELQGPGGGTVKESRPTKIRQLMGVGYKVKGEDQSSLN